MRHVEVCAVGCGGDLLDTTLKKLSAEGWNIRQVYQEPPAFYRVFAQRRERLEIANRDGKAESAREFVARHMGKMSSRKISAALLKELGIKRGHNWVAEEIRKLQNRA